MKEHLTFIIPAYNHDPSRLIKKISTLFLNYEIIIIDDGTNIDNTFTKTRIIRNTSNIGLAKSLVLGYKEALKIKSGFIVRIDADGEYPVESVKKAIKRMNAQHEFSIVGFRRTPLSNGLVDSLFNSFLGRIEGLLSIKKPFMQHAPSLQIFCYSFLKKVYPKLVKYTCNSSEKWGLDLVTIAFASKLTKIQVIETVNPEWFERRPINKIISQTKSSFVIIYKFITNQL